MFKGGGDLGTHPDALICLNNTTLINSPTQNHTDTVAAAAVKFRKGKSEGDHFITQKVLIYAFMPLIQRRKMDTQSGMILNYWKRCPIDHRCLWSGQVIIPPTQQHEGTLSRDVACHKGSLICCSPAVNQTSPFKSIQIR